MAELKPCPVCGRLPKLARYSGGFAMECTLCYVSTGFHCTEKAAMGAWNGMCIKEHRYG